MLRADDEKLNGLRTYIDGKMKRYDLLFAVNGGAFLIAKLEPEKLGKLDLDALALGAILFTVIMTVDIWVFAQGIRQDFFDTRDNVFTWIGKIILLALGGLLIVGWALARELESAWIVLAIGSMLLASGAAHLWIRAHPAAPPASEREPA